jgi:hypothetical protein
MNFMLLFWAPRDALAKPRSPEHERESGERWHAWAEELKEAGHSVTGAQLEAAGRCVTGAQRMIEDRAFGNDHLLGGYFIVSASSLEQATELAKMCPVLQNGGTVEVRPIMETD